LDQEGNDVNIQKNSQTTPLILAIDDSDEILKCYEIFFTKLEFNLLTATSGRQGIEKAISDKPPQ